MKKLIFIYKAKSDKLSKMIDFAHKIISPSTYACDLCSLTYWDFTIKKGRKDYLDNLNQQWIQTEFYYEERAGEFGITKEQLPVILFRNDDTEACIISGKEFHDITELSDLQARIDTYVNI